MEIEKEPTKEEVSVADTPHNRGQVIATSVLGVAMCAALTYAFLEHRSAKQLAASGNELSAKLNQEHSQVQTLAQELLAAESVAAAAPQPSLNSQTEAQVPIAKPKRVHHQSTTHVAVVKGQHAEDPWRKEIQAELTEQQKQLAEHQQQLRKQGNPSRKPVPNWRVI